MQITKLIIVALGLTGCVAMRPKMSNLRENMSETEVIHRLGKPDGFKRNGEFKSLEYGHRMISNWSADRADFHVIFKDDKVVEYGMGTVRVKDTGGLMIMPIVPLPVNQ